MLLQDAQQILFAAPAMIPLLIISFLAFIIVVAILWRKGKTVEALLVWNSLMLYIIALILLLT
ncbi:hypothetical protein KEJ45_02675 [Candidatus Bathyarchaeota archaeon]|nr:hypothetical protein [Candidatus Bathyarchaeota archaeon]